MGNFKSSLIDGDLKVTNGITGALNGNASSATKATQDSDGNKINATYLKLSGGAMTENISYNMNSSTQIPFKVYGGDVNGQGISVGAGGATIIGSGESAKACESLLTATTEELWVTSDNAIKFYTNCQTIGNKVGVFLNASRAFYPDTNNTGTLGTSSNKWNNVYATTFTGNLSGNASTATKLQTDINVQLSGDVTSNVTKMDSNNKISISTYRKGGCVGQSGNTTTKPWYKFASCTLDESYGDRNIVFNVYQGYSDASTKAGILIAHFRTNSNKIWESGELRWLIKTAQMPASDFVLAYNTTAPCKVELWCKCSSTYAGYHFDVISEGDRSSRGNYWTLHTNFSAGSQDAITSGYKQITSTVNKQSIEINTRNTTDTWIPVLKGGELQYTSRVFATGKTHTNHNTEQDRIPTLSFLSFWNGAYNSSNNSNLTYAHQGVIQCKPISLFDNSSGTAGTVTLSQTAANFSFIEVVFSRSSGNFTSRFYSPNGKTVMGTSSYYSKDSSNTSLMYLYSNQLIINGKTITYKYHTLVWWGRDNSNNIILGKPDNDDAIRIVKVVGYK